MRKFFAMVCLGLVSAALPAHGEVEISEEKIFTLAEKPLDVVVSRDGQHIFVLSEEGNLLIYTGEGVLSDRLEMGKSFEVLEETPGEGTLILTARNENLLKIVTLAFPAKINTKGSPFKGPEDAPVEIIVFSDFQ